ncbi:hypothetical protein [Minwuia sp.]|uniref:hypothetical protein n=1 Tax=Minwuia sp. TaxID=2493630 RepID=UPI003A950358
MKFLKAGLVAGSMIAIAAVLHACGGGAAAAGTCPKIGVLPDAADNPVTGPDGEVVALARLSVQHGTCIYDKSNASRTGYSKVRFPMTVRVSAARFQGARVQDIDVEYVVATVAPDGVITGRQTYSTTIGLSSATNFEDEKILIEIPYQGNGEASQHRVVAAFLIDRETVALNRSRLGR